MIDRDRERGHLEIHLVKQKNYMKIKMVIYSPVQRSHSEINSQSIMQSSLHVYMALIHSKLFPQWNLLGYIRVIVVGQVWLVAIFNFIKHFVYGNWNEWFYFYIFS